MSANFVQATDPNFGKAAGPEKPPEPVIVESHMVNVTAECRCSVTVWGTTAAGVGKAIPIRKCCGSHDVKLQELSVIAHKRMLALLDELRSNREK